MNFSAPNLDGFTLILAVLLWSLFWIGPAAGFLFTTYFCLTLPMRRQERARLFLDLLESGLRDGQGAEQTVQAVASSRDRSLGVRFHLLAIQLRSGYRLSQALEKVPRFLPSQVAAMLKVGERIGDLRKVFPACRQLLPDAESQTRGALNYLLLMLTSVVMPAGVAALVTFEIYVLPHFIEVSHELAEGLPPGVAFLMANRAAFVAAQVGLMLFLWLLVFLYVGGPRLGGWVAANLSSAVHRLQYAVPWRRRRMQRDFSAMLAVLLDAGVPEPEALDLAAGCTVNTLFARRAHHAIEELRAGRKLTEAIRAIDDAGEFRWRLTNATHAHGGFTQVLAGWNASLDAKAFQQEQAAAHVITTALILINGVIVGAVVTCVFQSLIAIINANSW